MPAVRRGSGRGLSRILASRLLLVVGGLSANLRRLHAVNEKARGLMLIGLDYASVDENQTPDFVAAKQAGARFAILRAVYGRRVAGQMDDLPVYIDPVWSRDSVAVIAAGLKRTAYLFVCYPRKGISTPPPETQAEVSSIMFSSSATTTTYQCSTSRKNLMCSAPPRCTTGRYVYADGFAALWCISRHVHERACVEREFARPRGRRAPRVPALARGAVAVASWGACAS